MTVQSPLGKLASPVAAFVVVVIILAYVAGLFLSLGPDAMDKLGDLALLALGAVFGSYATINGVKPEIDALHKRADAGGLPPAAGAEPDGNA